MATLLVLVAVAAWLAGPGAGRAAAKPADGTATVADVLTALEGTGYQLRYRQVPQVAGYDLVVGEATHRGTALQFSFEIRHAGPFGTAVEEPVNPQPPIVRYDLGSRGTVVGNVYIRTELQAPKRARGGFEIGHTKAESRIELDFVIAVERLFPAEWQQVPRVAGDAGVTGGDPYLVSAERLRSELAGSGAKIRFAASRGGAIPSVVGVARDGGAVIGFEFQLYPSSDVATVAAAGELRAARFGWPRRYRGFLLKVEVRGVLGNVVYTEYERGAVESHSTVREVNRRQRARQRIMRALDDALFASYPEDDPFAVALLTEG
ncbi:MAG TPA: hypothetical protein VFB52_04280 [Solirubrobacterales bacterium]|nr:hypothetical protein [Solirubrobacterales bacterium]